MSDPEALDELRQITASLRAHLEWQATSGASGLPAAPRASVAQVEARDPVPARTYEPPSELQQPARSRVPPPSEPAVIAVDARKPPPADLAERKQRLQVLADEIKTCTRCGLHAARTQTVFARGTGSSRLCFVGEGPGADEDAQGFPFVGKAGQLLDRMINAMGFDRDEVYVCNIVKCRPPNNRKPEPQEMAACMPYLAEQLELLDPEVIVALGATAVQGLLGTTEGIMRLRGKWKLYKGRIPVMPTFHPAYLLRTPAAKREVWDDLQAVLRQMGRRVPERK